MDLFVMLFGGILGLSGLAFSIQSMLEREKRAAVFFMISTIISSIMFLIVPFFLESGIEIIFGISCVMIAGGFILLLPVKGRGGVESMPSSKIDERDVMFSRMELEPGSERFSQYYKNNPIKLEKDDKFRQKPGLLSSEALKFNKLAFASADASFQTVNLFKANVDGVVNEKTENIDPVKLSEYIWGWAKKLGAVDVGITEMRDYHWYSISGRGGQYGQEVQADHKYGIAITVEMDKSMVSSAPDSPIIMESAQQYLDSGRIAMQIAAFIRNLGWDARAHIDGNYKVVCPLVARDAGLGEIGRMGLMMTPQLGPRTRIAVITTNVPLHLDEPVKDHSVEHFCEICKKCADNCPSAAIQDTDKQLVDGTRRWQINSESCFTYWCTIGTDCGQCVRVCPYSHENNWMHKMIRTGIRHSYLFRYFALWMDNVVYGRRPNAHRIPKWLE